MLVLGLQGSPRKGGNTDYALTKLLNACSQKGAKVEKLQISDLSIAPCAGCSACEKTGKCALPDDDMVKIVIPLLREADIVILASPVYFYTVTAQIKALIDRTQSLWSRKYRLGIEDPGRHTRMGILLALGATRGKSLFDGIRLTAKYFFDSIGASPLGELTYRRMENPGDMARYPGLEQDIESLLSDIDSFFKRPVVLFACRENACRSQMAYAFARYYHGNKIDVLSAGSRAADTINPLMVKAMAELGLDMEYRRPVSLDDVLGSITPQRIVTMGCGEECPLVSGCKIEDWELPDPSGKDFSFMQNIRDEIRKRVDQLASRY